MQVVPDCPVRNVELLADLAVGEARGRQAGDLQFLRGELVPRRRNPTTARFAGGAEFLPGAFRQAWKGQRIEALPSRPQRRTRVGDAALAAQPPAIPSPRCRHGRPRRGAAWRVTRHRWRSA